ncbi:TetR/AcrR family transcriptional regulator [Streptomyces sp. AJS327]|uniref:TetR/AcrR family transcriptional regulator n=1 Tax=Streptomyces sp. AJS327 TaxID=2545265 RepID=UPI0015DF833A|nr:TetR/AcrR family transcriptional regulator [Streptomyces sp. AJS327]MBA0049911.1 TetR/AcrR family transcriptional regulator [Streptomyces sp. AJS327]
MGSTQRPRTGSSGLPPGVEAAWGLRERPGKGPARGVDLPRVVHAAVEIAAEEGLSAVSMSRVASEVGVSTMALYRYVSGKDELLILMEDAAFDASPPGPPPGEGWREGLSQWARAYRKVLWRHKWIMRIPVSTPPVSPTGVAWMEHGLRYLRRTGLGGEEQLATLMLLSGFVRSHVSLAADMEAATGGGRERQEQAEAHYWELLARLTRGGHYPAITALLESGLAVRPTPDGEAAAPTETDRAAGDAGVEEEFDPSFDFGLAIILDGIEAREARAATRSAPDGADGR